MFDLRSGILDTGYWILDQEKGWFRGHLYLLRELLRARGKKDPLRKIFLDYQALTKSGGNVHKFLTL